MTNGEEGDIWHYEFSADEFCKFFLHILRFWLIFFVMMFFFFVLVLLMSLKRSARPHVNNGYF